MQRRKRRGKLPSLPRVKFLRQIEHKLTQVATWSLLLFFFASQAGAAYSPANVADLLASAKPVNPIRTIVSTPQPEVKDEVKAEEEPAASTPVLAEASDRPTPEIVIEIKAAEYIPPKPTVASFAPVVSNGFPYGQCTYYVAMKRPVGWGGNAGTWYYAAQAAGYKVGKTPAAGAIMISYEGNPAGHAAYVESVNSDGSFTVSEMNYNGNWGRVTFRTLNLRDAYIVGFIY